MYRPLLSLKFLIRTSFDAAARLFLMRLGFEVWLGVSPVLMLGLMEKMIDAASAVVQLGTGYSTRLYQAIVMVAGIHVLNRFIETLNDRILKKRLRQHIDIFLAKKIYQHGAKLEFSKLDDSSFYDEAEVVKALGPAGFVNMLESVAIVFRSIITIAGIFVLLVKFQSYIALILGASMLPLVIVQCLYSKKRIAQDFENSEKMREACYYGNILADRKFRMEILLHSIVSLFIKRWESCKTLIIERFNCLSLAEFRWIGACELLFVVSFYSAYVLAGSKLVGGEIAIGAFVVYTQLFSRLNSAGLSVSSGFSSLLNDYLKIDSLRSFLSTEASIDYGNGMTLPAGEVFDIEFRNVYFKYKDEDRWILNGLSLTLKKGEFCGILGLNGAGKTTLLKLLLRFYEPNSGDIYLGGVPLRRYALADVRKYFSVMFQDVNKYELSVRENIWIGDPCSSDSVDEFELLSLEGFRFIDRLPDGINTRLGVLFFGGHDLSLGEWQKIAVARAVFRNRSVLILDEPTSAFDVESEHELISWIRRRYFENTFVVITHRLNAIRLCDRVIVVKNGRSIESGPPSSLIKDKNSMYRRLAKLSNHSVESCV